MKNKKSTFILLTAIAVLVVVLHYKLHSNNNANNEDTPSAKEIRMDMADEQSLFPAIFYRLAEIRRY